MEDEAGQIVAGSWVWTTKNTLDDPGQPGKRSPYQVACFDNVEAKGLGSRNNTVADLYQMAGDDLAKTHNIRTVTIGTGLSDLSLHRWSKTDSLTLPSQYSGYSDASKQVLLAENTEARPATQENQQIWVRGALEGDLESAQEVANLVYPAGYQHVSYPDGGDPRGLVLMHEKQGVIGYAVWSEDSHEISDLAVHPAYRWCSQNLLRSTMAHCRESGGEWTADMREESSYRLMKIYDRRGEIEIIDDRGITNDLGNGDYTHGITFRVPENPVIPRGQGPSLSAEPSVPNAAAQGSEGHSPSAEPQALSATQTIEDCSSEQQLQYAAYRAQYQAAAQL